ncbi:MAG: hypothetical protein V3W41_05835 [Planctomycetota bacterium]
MKLNPSHALGFAVFFFLAASLLGQTVTPTDITSSPSPACAAGGSETHTVCITLPPDTTTSSVDVFLLFDDTGSFASSVPATIAVFNQVVTDLQAALPSVDFAFGVGRFEDYGGPGEGFSGEDIDGRPFTLNQAILRANSPGFLAAINAALANTAPGFGGDSPESAIGEGLYQIATGLGYDGNGDGLTSNSGAAGDVSTQTNPGVSGDVPAFSTYTGVTDGSLGGVGFRPAALKLVILATDVCTVAAFDVAGGIPVTVVGTGSAEPASAFACVSTTPGVERFGFVSDSLTLAGNTVAGAVVPLGAATVPSTVSALNALGIRVIGLAPGGAPVTSTTPSFDPSTYLSALARLTGAVDDMGDPLVFNISGGAAPVAAAIVSAVTVSSTSDIDVILTADPAQPGLSVTTVPAVHLDVSPGDMVCFDVTLSGDGSFGGGTFDLNFRDQASNGIVGNLPVSLTCDPPVCIAPTPAVELGGANLEALLGFNVNFPIVAQSATGGNATIVSVSAEFAPFAGGGCGTFSSVPVPAGVSHSPGLGVSGAPAMTTLNWVPTSNSLVGCWRFTYALIDDAGNTGTCSVVVEVTECMMLAGFSALSYNVTPTDILLVDPQLIKPITLTSIPSLAVPNNPALVGFKVFLQVFMFNNEIFPTDPLRMSAGIEVEIGVANTVYGSDSGMNLWLNEAVIYPGDSIDIQFGIPGL